MSAISDMRPIARDGEIFILVDGESTGDNPDAVMYDSLSKQASRTMPVNPFFKWGNFEAVPDGTTFEMIRDNPNA